MLIRLAGQLTSRQETVRGHHGPICMVMSELTTVGRGRSVSGNEWAIEMEVNFFSRRMVVFLFTSSLPGMNKSTLYKRERHKMDRSYIDEDRI